MIPQEFVDSLLQKIDIVDIVGKHVELKKTGSNYLGLCPFHKEKSPSFTVSPYKNFYHCFGCGASGDAINFLKNHLNLHYVESLEHLANHLGIKLPPKTSIDKNANNSQQNISNNSKDKLNSYFIAMKNITAFYKQQLKQNTLAIEYLKSRGITGITARNFALGYANNAWNDLSQLNLPKQILIDMGMLSHKEDKYYDKFRHRIMFPIRNIKGEIIAFGGRSLDLEQKPKYLNSPETILFNKSNTLYGLFENINGIKQAQKILVVEGYMDVIALNQYGINYAVATLGTACTLDHILSLFRYTQHIIFSFDGDTAGYSAAIKALEKIMPALSDERKVEFLFLPKEHDPDSFIRANGVEAFLRLVNHSMPLSSLLIQTLIDGLDLNIAENRAKVLKNSNAILKQMPTIFLKKQIQQNIWAATNVNKNIRNANSNNWGKSLFNKQIVSALDTFMFHIFNFANLVKELNDDDHKWISNYSPDLKADFWQLANNFSLNQDKNIWLNSSYSSIYLRLSQLEIRDNEKTGFLKLAINLCILGLEKSIKYHFDEFAKMSSEPKDNSEKIKDSTAILYNLNLNKKKYVQRIDLLKKIELLELEEKNCADLWQQYKSLQQF